jgi:hypothetical protein
MAVNTIDRNFLYKTLLKLKKEDDFFDENSFKKVLENYGITLTPTIINPKTFQPMKRIIYTDYSGKLVNSNKSIEFEEFQDLTNFKISSENVKKFFNDFLKEIEEIPIKKFLIMKRLSQNI